MSRSRQSRSRQRLDDRRAWSPGHSWRTFTLPALVLACTVGCSGGPSRIIPPTIDADDAAAEAMKLHDADGDGAIAGAELDAAPALKAAMETLDLDKNGKVTAEEITRRIETWQATGIGILAVQCGVTLDGRSLDDAVVTFEPAPFLGNDIKAGVGKTGRAGSTIVSIPKDQRPTTDTPAGLQVGLYRVRISKKVNGEEVLPAKFNTESSLGQQVAPDDPAMLKQDMSFILKSNY